MHNRASSRVDPENLEPQSAEIKETPNETLAWLVTGRGVSGAELRAKDYFSVPEEEIPRIESLMTVTAGRIVYAAGPFAEHAPPLAELTPMWSPVAHFGGYVNEDEGEA